MTRQPTYSFYLPQFHAIPENDAWWGQGFTEWTTVRRAEPLFDGHRQPRVPAQGYYELPSSETFRNQIDLADEFGVDGFIFWHYWFAGRRLLEAPMDFLISNPDLDMPFAVAWANESWTRTWAGRSREVLVPQTYPGEEDDRRHAQHLATLMADERYIRTADGRPMLFIYRPHSLPSVDRFRSCVDAALHDVGSPPVHLVGEVTRRTGTAMRALLDDVYLLDWGAMMGRMLPVRKRMGRAPVIRDYRTASSGLHQASVDLLGPTAPPLVLAGWDNTPRHGRSGTILSGFTPEALADSMAEARGLDATFVLIKSWNEWSEGNYLEPDELYGRDLLKAVRP